MTYEQLEDLFYTLKISASPSAFHGFLCGRLSCGVIEIRELIKISAEWLALSPEQSDAAEVDLQEFYEDSLSNLEDVSFLFKPTLPDDELPLGDRLLAIGDWCSNYISGLGDGMGDSFKFSEDGREALEDLTAIGQISVDFESDDEGERDYTELIEYVRLAVQVIFSDLHPNMMSEESPTIH